jgi:SAM-dependent methyltransferase
VRPDELCAHSSSRRPSVERGELAVLYAAVWQAIFAVVEISDVPEHDPTRSRWSWRFAIRPLTVVADLREAPPVEAAGVFPQSLWRHSHIRLTEEQFHDARRLVEAAALNPKRVVAAGYDSIADRYLEWAASFHPLAVRWVENLLRRLPVGSDLLDLGCGRGVPATRALAQRHRVTGVDISRAQIERARREVPEATFLQGDAATLEWPSASFDAVVSLYMFGHVPRRQQARLLERIGSWLRPGGWLLCTMGIGGSDDVVEDDWLGVPMFFASFDADTNRGLVRDAGFELVSERIVPQEEPGHGLVSFMWVLARRPN